MPFPGLQSRFPQEVPGLANRAGPQERPWAAEATQRQHRPSLPFLSLLSPPLPCPGGPCRSHGRLARAPAGPLRAAGSRHGGDGAGEEGGGTGRRNGKGSRWGSGRLRDPERCPLPPTAASNPPGFRLECGLVCPLKTQLMCPGMDPLEGILILILQAADRSGV